jgi:hypothetical protein
VPAVKALASNTVIDPDIQDEAFWRTVQDCYVPPSFGDGREEAWTADINRGFTSPWPRGTVTEFAGPLHPDKSPVVPVSRWH